VKVGGVAVWGEKKGGGMKNSPKRRDQGKERKRLTPGRENEKKTLGNARRGKGENIRFTEGSRAKQFG